MKMKRLFLTIAIMLISVCSFAIEKDLDKDITMVSYEQRWLDSEGTLALKNNTDVEIRNVAFIITYLDMSNNELDYKEFVEPVVIAPGMTKKLDIPAYEHSRFYHYYKTKDDYSDHPAFKIRFQLKDYNVENTAIDESYTSEYGWKDRYDSDNDNFSTFLFFVLVLFVLGLFVGLYMLVAIMAQQRGRNAALWIIASILATPLLIIIILLIIGNDERDGY